MTLPLCYPTRKGAYEPARNQPPLDRWWGCNIGKDYPFGRLAIRGDAF